MPTVYFQSSQMRITDDHGFVWYNNFERRHTKDTDRPTFEWDTNLEWHTKDTDLPAIIISHSPTILGIQEIPVPKRLKMSLAFPKVQKSSKPPRPPFIRRVPRQ